MAGIFRYRRYRVFLAFAVISLVALWQFSGGVLRSKVAGPSPRPPVRYPHTEATSARDGSGAAPILPVGASTPSEVETVTATTIRTQVEAQPEQHEAAVQTAPPSDFADRSLSQLPIQQGEGRLEMPADPVSTIAAIHWTSMPEHFPVPSGSTIQLPEGTPKPIPRIQHAFGREDDKKKAERLVRLDTVKAAIAHAWAGYREKAWMKDEVSPVSGKSRDPFCGWGATLVDSLDTLWIVGLKKEFEEAVEAVRHIDFTTSKRGDIPVFETVIRYLGGLLAAYDVSEGKYRILLDKAVELGDVLMGAFDTPNRMPIVYYNWKP